MLAMIRTIDGWNLSVARVIAFAGVLGVLANAVLIIGDILLRLVLDAPIVGINEYVEMFFAVAVTATFPAAIAARGHLRINILGKLGPGAAAWLTVLGSVLLLYLFVLLAWRASEQAVAAGAQQMSTQIHELPMAPVFWTITTIIVLCAVNQLVVLISDTAEADSRKSGHLSLLTSLVLVAVFAIGLFIAVNFHDVTKSLSGFAWDSPARLALIVFGLMWICLLLFIPIAAVTGLLAVGASAMLIGADPALSVIGSEMTGFLTNSEVSVLPLFLIMGVLVAAAGISDDVFRLAQALFGHLRGGLALASIGGCAGFGAVTGSSIATVATIGSASLPEMKKRGYSTSFSTGSIAAGGTLGALVPPSGALVVYAFLTEESIGQLFIAALIPALIAIAFYMITIAIWVRLSPGSVPKQDQFSLQEVWRATRRGAAVFGMFALVMGGIYLGFFTVNEAAAVGAVCAFLIAWSRGKLSGSAFWRVMGEAASLTAMIYALIIGGLTLSFFVGTTNLPNDLTDYVSALNLTPLVTIALLMIVYILLGAIMEAFAIMIITVPIVAGLIVDMNFSLIWWGIIMLVVLEIGQISPPFGMNVFVLQSVAGRGVRLGTIYLGVLPFLLADLMKLTILILFPILILWLPATSASYRAL